VGGNLKKEGKRKKICRRREKETFISKKKI